MADKLQPKTALDRGPVEEPIRLDPNDPEYLPEGGGDTAAMDSDTNVGGAPSTAGLDSGGAVGVRRGRAVGRPGFEYDTAPHGETTQDAGLEGELAQAEEEALERGESRETGEEGPNLPA